MKEKLLYLVWSIYREIVYSGLYEGVTKDLRKKIVRFNQFILLALLLNFFSVLSYFYYKLYISALVNITAAYFFLLAFWFGSRGKLETGRIMAIINLNLYLFVICYIEGLRAGEYLLYFPYFVVLTFVVSIRRNFKELLAVYSITIVISLLCVKFSPWMNDVQKINEALYQQLYSGNLVLSLAMTIIFSYSILRVNKDNEVAILQEKKFGDTIFNTSLDGVFIIFSQSNIVASCNQRALELFEVSEKREIEGTHIADWFEEDHIKHFDSIKETVSTERNWQGELALTTKTGRTFYGFASVVHFIYKDTGYTKISILDVSNVKMAEFELMKAKEKAEAAARTKSRFLSNMSHELRTPLNGIIGASNLLLQEEKLAEQIPHLDILKFSSEHMLMLINDILDYNKMEAGKVELAEQPVNIKEFMHKVSSQFSAQVKAKGLEFKVDVDDRLDVELLTDNTRLQQVMGNLLANAIKFTHSGTITMAVRKLFSSSTKSTLQFIVMDTGIGIPKNKHKEIFDSFTQADVNTTRKYGGTGLGLAITKRIVNMFNSDLLLESEEGKGSAFHFTVELKICENRKRYINENNITHLHQLEGVRVLIAEDNPVNLSIARRFLTKWGILVTEAVNGKEAVAEFKKGQFDLLLVDLEMPEMDGATALKEIRKLNTSVPVVAFTAAVYDNIQADLLQKGFTDFIHKPFRPEELHSKISYLVNALRATA